MTDRLCCGKCHAQRFNGNHVIHLGNLHSFEERRDCRLCSFVLDQLVKTQAPQNSLVFLRPVPESPPTYAIILDDVESKIVEGWISFLSKPTEAVGWIEPHNGSSNKLDRKQVQTWLHECQSVHHHSSKSDMVSQDLVDLVLIDVQNGMLVDAEPQWEFVALSYVNGGWGGSHFNLDDFTKNDLKAPGILFSSIFPLPAVVRDAIDLVRDLGKRYLWCDFICIFQDDHTQKQTQIRQMDSIYGKALFTIIALSAKHGNTGLPGVRDNSRDSFCPVVDLDDGKRAVARAPELETIKLRSVYSQRGWTFQEEVLLQRCLYLADSQAYFTCPEGYKREDEHKAADSTRLGHSNLFTCFEQDVSSTRPHTEQLFSLCTTLLREYNGRQLTYDTDILDAFDGIRKVLSRKFSTEFICGLPQSQLHHALLWIPSMHLERRFELAPELPEGTSPIYISRDEEMSWFMRPPTWSWAAWRGKVGFLSPIEMPFSEVSWIQHFGILSQRGILPVETSTTKLVERKEQRKLFFRLRSSLRKALSSLWPGVSHREQPPCVSNPSKLAAATHFKSLEPDIPFEDLQLFVLDLFRPGICLICEMVFDLLPSARGPAPEEAFAFRCLREEEIAEAFSRWQSISQSSLVELDSCTPTSNELMESWTAITNDFTLTYDGRSLWPFKSWFQKHSTDAYSYVLERLLEFLGTELRPHMPNVWLREAMQRECVVLERFPLSRPNALCFFTYSTSVGNLSTYLGQLYKSSLKSTGFMTTSSGLACDLGTLQFSRHDGIKGDVEQPVTAFFVTTNEEGNYEKADTKDYAGVLFDYKEKVRLETSTQLLLLSSGPPYSGSGTLRHATWNMMLVRPVEDGFYERVAVGRLREDAMVRGKFTWDCKYIRLA